MDELLLSPDFEYKLKYIVCPFIHQPMFRWHESRKRTPPAELYTYVAYAVEKYTYAKNIKHNIITCLQRLRFHSFLLNTHIYIQCSHRTPTYTHNTQHMYFFFPVRFVHYVSHLSGWHRCWMSRSSASATVVCTAARSFKNGHFFGYMWASLHVAPTIHSPVCIKSDQAIP